jgi:hypothetical protein
MAEQGRNHQGETRAECYTRNIGEILGTLDALKAHILETQIPAETAQWEHVGSTAHISELLDEVAEFAGLKIGE